MATPSGRRLGLELWLIVRRQQLGKLEFQLKFKFQLKFWVQLEL